MAMVLGEWASSERCVRGCLGPVAMCSSASKIGIVGNAKLDNRSSWPNFEVSMMFYDRARAADGREREALSPLL